MVRRAFLAGEFQRLLRRLNPDLRVYCGDADNRPAGLVLVRGDSVRELCGVDKGMIPDQTIIAENGQIIKKGWRAVFSLLIRERLVSKTAVLRLVPEYGLAVSPVRHSFRARPEDEAIDYFRSKRPEGQSGLPVFTRKDLMELGDAFHGKRQ